MFRALSAYGVTGLLASSMLLAGCNAPETTSRPSDGGSLATDGGSPVDPEEKADLEKLAESMRNFRKDTTGWPWGGSVWRFGDVDDVIGVRPQLEPGEFTDNDVALFRTAMLGREELPICEQGKTDPCWQGPYVHEGSHMIDKDNVDKWGHKRFFTIIRPFGTNLGGTSAAPDGAVVIWSAGPDGLDQTGCTTTDVGSANCGEGKGADLAKIATGQMSVPGDDIVVVVSNSSR